MSINDPKSTPSAERVDELSQLDIIEFIHESWKTISGLAVLGIAGAFLYINLIPKEYEAGAQIKMGKVVNAFNDKMYLVNIEEPQELIARMALPTSYSKETIALCNPANQKDTEVVLLSKVKFSIPKGVNGTIDLKVYGATKEIVKACANSVFQLIKAYQAQLIIPYVDDINKKLKIEEGRLGSLTQFIANSEKYGLASGGNYYFAIRDEMHSLRAEISNLQYIISNINRHPTYLSTPIYVSDQPVSPRKKRSLVVGLLLGGCLGLAFSLVRRLYLSNRSTFN